MFNYAVRRQLREVRRVCYTIDMTPILRLALKKNPISFPWALDSGIFFVVRS